MEEIAASPHIFEAARLCYELGLSQREAAAALGVSPPTISRLLRKARASGIVRVSVLRLDDYVTTAERLRGAVADALGIAEVIIVPTSAASGYVRSELARAGAQWLDAAISSSHSSLTIGFSGGRTVAQTIPFLRPARLPVHIVQLMGGVSSTDQRIQADAVVRDAAARLVGTPYVLHAPAVFPDAIPLRQLIQAPVVAECVARFQSLDIAFVGIGTLHRTSPLIDSGVLAPEDINRLVRSGAVGEICGRFLDAGGRECEHSLAARTLAVGLEDLAQTPRVCAIATGKEKVPAIAGACRSGIVKTLVTDTDTATHLASGARLKG